MSKSWSLTDIGQASLIHRGDICFGASSIIDLSVSGLPMSIEQTEGAGESCLASSPGSLLSLTASKGKYLTWDKFHITRRSKFVGRNSMTTIFFGERKLSWSIQVSLAKWPSHFYVRLWDFTDHCFVDFVVYVLYCCEHRIRQILIKKDH